MKYFSYTLQKLLDLKKTEIVNSILDANGRTIMGEIICKNQQTYPEISDAELVSAFGADIILLNQVDILNPLIPGITDLDPVRRVMDLTGKLVGIILEPDNIEINPIDFDNIILQCIKMQVKYIVLTSNPLKNDRLELYIEALKRIRNNDQNNELIIIIGKLHFNNLEETINDFFTQDSVSLFKEYGADAIVVPSPGTCPGSDLNTIKTIIDYAHKQGLLAMAAIATTQEDSGLDTLKDIALLNKMAGADIHHIGDGGIRCASPDNIMAYSIAIRGKRHTYTIMAKSIKRY